MAATPRLAAAARLLVALSLPALGAARLGAGSSGNATLGGNASVRNASDDVRFAEEGQPVSETALDLLDLEHRLSMNESMDVEVGAFARVGIQAAAYGFQWAATTTRYGNTASSSCGGLDTVNVVRGTGYYTVASSQAMQSVFPWGADCCYCGAAASTQVAQGTAAMGCFTCARGRFLDRRPQENGGHGSRYKTETIRIVVVDICPANAQRVWCQQRPGDRNKFGEKNHFDFCVPPRGIDNHYFVFTPEECSPEIKRRMKTGADTCALETPEGVAKRR